jgi:hypothetical protein
MQQKWLILFLIFSTTSVIAQIENDNVDTKYLEDQIYASLFYNILTNKPSAENNNLFSAGLSVGFIKDIPFNKQRNFGIGLGLGYEFNSYNYNVLIFIDENGDGETDNYDEFNTNSFKTQIVEMPFEIRWRTSTPTKYNFWRIYSGVKIGYIFHSKAKLESIDSPNTFKNINVFNKFQYGLTFAAGYGTWNIYAYYGLNPIFDVTYPDGTKLDLKDFKLGLKFYIL